MSGIASHNLAWPDDCAWLCWKFLALKNVKQTQNAGLGGAGEGFCLRASEEKYNATVSQQIVCSMREGIYKHISMAWVLALTGPDEQ